MVGPIQRRTTLKRVPYDLAVNAVGWSSRLGTVLLNLASIGTAARLLGTPAIGQLLLVAGACVWFTIADFGYASALQNEVSRRRGLGLSLASVASAAMLLSLTLISVAIPVTAAWAFAAEDLLSMEGGSVYSPNSFAMIAFIAGISAWVNGINQICSRLLVANGCGVTPYLATLLGSILSWGLIHSIPANAPATSPITVCLIIYLVPVLVPAFLVFVLSTQFQNTSFSFYEALSLLKALWPEAKPFGYFILLGSLVLQCDYWILARFVDAISISQYSFASRLFAFALTLYGVSLGLLWPKFTEAIGKRDVHAVVSAARQYLTLGIIGVASLAPIVSLCRNTIFGQLLGIPEAAIPTPALILSMGIYAVLRVWTDTFAMILQAAGQVSVLLLIVPVQAAISIIGQVALCAAIGVYGSPLAISFSFVVTVAWYLPYRLKDRVFSRTGAEQRCHTSQS